jgi:glutaconyl-CoA/methylmalonyl-CoA decarboxylase subunit delta
MSLYPTTTLAIGLPANPTMLDLVEFSLAGMLVVLLSLTLLAVCCTVIGFLLRRLTPSPLTSRPAFVTESDMPEETVAVIAAAVAAAICAPHRIVQIRGLTPEDLSWSLEGRLQHHASHMPKQRH